MRTITITRRKSFVGCLGKMKVYIEDRKHPDLTISGTPCRFLGKLKNGETATFPIPTTEALLYVIADKVSRNYCSEVLPIIEGEENIYVSGQNRFDPTQGHPFRFDGINGNVTMQHRMKTSKKGLIVFIAALVIGTLIGLALALISFAAPAKPQTFSEEDFSITLTDEFKKKDRSEPGSGYTPFHAAYLSEEVTVIVNQENREYLNYSSLKNFAEHDVAYTADYDCYIITKELTECGELLWYEYDYYHNERPAYHYTTYFYDKNGYFYYFEFITKHENFEDYRDEINAWASSVSFE